MSSANIRPFHSAAVPDTPNMKQQSALFTDEEINVWLSNVNLLQYIESLADPTTRLYTLLGPIIKSKPATMRYASVDVIERLLKDHPYLNDLLRKGDYKAVLLSDVFRAPTYNASPSQSTTSALAAEGAWHLDYRGDADALYTILETYMARTDSLPYARCASFAQSSGTGKSRMTDELAKKILCIPINLSRTTDVYPPSDQAVVRFLSDTPSQEACENTFHAFLYGLFDVVRQHLTRLATGDDAFNDEADVDIDQRVAGFASKFRKNMNEGMTFGQHGQYHIEFFDSVIARAKEFKSRIRSSSTPTLHTSPTRKVLSDIDGGATVEAAAEALLRLLNPKGWWPADKPLVVLCFDESHLLPTVIGGGAEGAWSRFSVLRRALSTIVELPIFTLFLSTMGNLEQLAPPPPKKASSRLMGRTLATFPPICLTRLDHFAPFLKKLDKSWTLNRVAFTYHIAHLGRPLFGAMYDAGSRRFQAEIVYYAQTKLLRSDHTPTPLKDLQSLACIAVRVPIAFLSTAPPQSSVERDLVAEHLRILLYASPGFTQIITTCPSEPLLAEAACDVFRRRWNGGKPVASISRESGPISALSYHLDRSHLDVGTRGEVLAAVLLLDARDRATTYPIPTGSSQYSVGLEYDGLAKRRIVTLPLFLKALLGASYSETCLKSLPAEYRSDVDAYTSLETAFKDYHIYFNHFIKARDFGLVNTKYLRLAISRGAAIICADNQAAIDIVIPCLRGSELLEENVSVILVQVKNSRTFADKIKPNVFAAMDPFDCDVFDSQPLPIVRMVFALASKQSVVKVRPVPTRKLDRAPSTTFTAYDIWCAGVTEQTFGVIQNKREESDAQRVVQLMRNQGDAEWQYTDPELKIVVEAMQPLVSTELDHCSSWAEL